jgi:acetyl-CoA synthetase (ADP-forming)
MLYTEKKAGEFLEKEGFVVHKRIFVFKESDLNKLAFPYVMKVSGSTIVHKSKLGGVRVGVKDLNEAKEFFNQCMKISGAEGVILQSLIEGRFFILGLKATPEFGFALIFGDGGIDVEEKKDVAFRICPVNKEDILEMIKDTNIGKTLSKSEKEFIVENLLKLSSLANKYPNILELDINPIISGEIVDSRIVFKD